MPPTSTIPAKVKAVTIEKWRDRFALRYGTERESAAIRKAFQRGREALLTDHVAISDPYVWLTAQQAAEVA